MTAHNNSQHRDDTAPGAPNLTTTPQQTAHQTQRTAVLAEHVRAIVDSFPPLTPEQQDRIATLLRTTS